MEKSNKFDIIELTIHMNGQIIGKLDRDKDTQQIHELFWLLHNKLDGYSIASATNDEI
jgi:hypothetical protein